MVQTMVLLDDMVERRSGFNNDILTTNDRSKLKKALDKGIDYTLKAQIINDGQPTVWGAQHDPVTYAPVPGRAYELASNGIRVGGDYCFSGCPGLRLPRLNKPPKGLSDGSIRYERMEPSITDK